MGDISENLSRREMACQCSCGFNTVDVELVAMFELVRDLNGGVPITPLSGARCAFHNEKVGGGSRSQHLAGKAVDLPVKNPREIYMKLDEMFPLMYGLGLYDWGLHADVRAKRARWGEVENA